jgi:hypothetical protein
MQTLTSTRTNIRTDSLSRQLLAGMGFRNADEMADSPGRSLATYRRGSFHSTLNARSAY